MLQRMLVLVSAACAVMAQEWPSVRLHEVASGLQNITDLRGVPGGAGRLVVLEQRGRIRLIEGGRLRPEPVLDWSSRVSCCGERGLLGIAFPPGFGAGKQHFYVNYTDLNGNTVIARFRYLAASHTADPQSEQVVLRVEQPFANHNGGQIQFGPDGYLYIGMGDGGSANDPQDNGQRTGTLLGKMLRIDVESGSATYTVPASNPFNGRAEYRSEIWATGLRNPWRFSFDRETGDLWIADVGQNRAEEVNFQPAASKGGENYGWRLMEGLQCAVPATGCNRDGLTLPILEYPRSLGVSVTGGYVYRGKRQPVALRGVYLYGDFGTGRLWGIRRVGSAWENRQLATAPGPISTFGEDENGEVYVGSYAGSVYLLVAGEPAVAAVVNAASFAPGLSPGGVGTIFGTNLTAWSGITEGGGIAIDIGGTAAPVLGAANVGGQEQINFLIPYSVAPGPAKVTVRTNGGGSAAFDVNVVPVQPEIFAVTRNGREVTLWATGLGPVNGAPETGRPAPLSPLITTVMQPEVLAGTAAATVTFSGLAPTWVGLYQVNATLPENVPLDAPLTLRIGGAVSRPK